MYQAVEVLIPLAAIAMVFGIVYLGVTAENRKNLAMIEAGMNPNEKTGFKGREGLKKGLLLVFIPLGYILSKKLEFVSQSNFSGIIGAVLFGGIALILFYFIELILDRNKKIEA